MTNMTISLRKLQLLLLDVPQKESFTSGIGKRTSRKTLIVVWEDQEGRIGYGECSCRPDPYYSAEFLESVVLMLKKFALPHLQPQQTYSELLAVLQKIRGWNFGKSAIEAAAFSILQQKGKVSFSDTLEVEPIRHIPVGISLGIYQDKHELEETVQKHIEAGYRRLKFKISPKVDTQVFDFVNSTLFDADTIISFDANGSYGKQDFGKLAYFIHTYPNAMIEQPFSPSNFHLCLAAKKQFSTLRVCYDEEVKNFGDVVKLHQLEVLDELNLKVGRVGGVAKSLEILAYCHTHEIPCWIGGMFETGVGRLLNLQFASYLPRATAHDLSPSERYFIEDIIDPAVTMDKGYIDIVAMQKCAVKLELVEKFTISEEAFKW